MAGQQDLPDITEGEDAGFSVLDVANPSKPVPDVRRHLPGDLGEHDWPDITEGEDAGVPALDVENPSKPVPDLRRHLPRDHGQQYLPDIFFFFFSIFLFIF